jgi:hypothetical protein
MQDIYIDVPSPFGLSRPTRAWCDVIAHFDPDLRIFPSQTHPLFRLMRKAHNTPMGATVARMEKAQRDGVLEDIHPDTQIAIHHGLVAVFTLPSAIVTVSPESVVEKLKRRDQWQFKDGDAVADHVEANESAEERAIDVERARQYRERRRQAGISLSYRTGARVSLVSPRRHPASAETLGTPGGAAVTVSPTE